MVQYKKLEKVKSAFFFIGFFTSQLKHIPFALLLALSNIAALLLALSNVVALAFYLTGYLFWLASSHASPDHPNPCEKWYSFAQIKNQHRVAATLGIISVFCAFTALIIPIFIIPSCWFLVSSSCIWCISEYHKLQNPLAREENYSHSQQQSYFRYSGTIALMTLVAAITTTIPVFFPAVALATLTISVMLEGILGITAFYYWVNYNFGNHKPDHQNNQQSYDKLIECFPGLENTSKKKLGIQIVNTPSPSLSPINSKTPKSSSGNISLTNGLKARATCAIQDNALHMRSM